MAVVNHVSHRYFNFFIMVALCVLASFVYAVKALELHLPTSLISSSLKPCEPIIDAILLRNECDEIVPPSKCANFPRVYFKRLLNFLPVIGVPPCFLNSGCPMVRSDCLAHFVKALTGQSGPPTSKTSTTVGFPDFFSFGHFRLISSTWFPVCPLSFTSSTRSVWS